MHTACSLLASDCLLTACVLSLHSHGSWRRTVLLLPLPLPLQLLLLRFCFVLFWFFVVDFRLSANSPVLQSVYTCLFLASHLFCCSFIGMGVVVVLYLLLLLFCCCCLFCFCCCCCSVYYETRRNHTATQMINYMSRIIQNALKKEPRLLDTPKTA